LGAVFEHIPADLIFTAAHDLLRRELGSGRRFRLVGVGVSNFQEDYQLALWPAGRE
jgi:hypothetical protein